jgi:cytochrome d ubiquinol oxidase subunit II
MIVAVMIAVYVILDGFDIGAGIVHYLVGRNSKEREVVIGSIGPVWDGNEVWLLAAGGTLYFAFPVLYSAGFSGFYLPLIIVLWLLIMRATGIELRHQLDNQMWHSFWDFVFSLASILLAIFFGAALGNVIRGVPLNSEGYFFEPLWTTFTVTENPGILDWFTVLTGAVALVALAIHGASYLAVKTEGEMNTRSRKIVGRGWFALVAVTILSLIGVTNLRDGILDNYRTYPVGWIIPVVVFAALAGIKYFNAMGKDLESFLSSCGYLAFMLVGAVFALYPTVLPAMKPGYSLTIHNASAGGYGLSVGLIWWSIGILIALGYFYYLFKTFSGKVQLNGGHYSAETESEQLGLTDDLSHS